METILGDALDARLVGCRTAGYINVMEAYCFIVNCNIILLFIIPVLSGSVALTTLLTFHAEHVEINLSVHHVLRT